MVAQPQAPPLPLIQMEFIAILYICGIVRAAKQVEYLPMPKDFPLATGFSERPWARAPKDKMVATAAKLQLEEPAIPPDFVPYRFEVHMPPEVSARFSGILGRFRLPRARMAREGIRTAIMALEAYEQNGGAVVVSYQNGKFLITPFVQIPPQQVEVRRGWLKRLMFWRR